MALQCKQGCSVELGDNADDDARSMVIHEFNKTCITVCSSSTLSLIQMLDVKDLYVFFLGKVFGFKGVSLLVKYD